MVVVAAAVECSVVLRTNKCVYTTRSSAHPLACKKLLKKNLFYFFNLKNKCTILVENKKTALVLHFLSLARRIGVL